LLGHTDYEGTILSQSSCPILGKVKIKYLWM
jgi:hypothetical protein